MLGKWNNLFANGVIAAAVMLAAVQARGSVVVCDRELSGQGAFGRELSPWTDLQLGPEMEQAESGRATPRASSFPTLAIDAPSEGDAEKRPTEKEWDSSLSESPMGMAPASSSLSQVGGAGVGGFVVESELEVPPHDSLQATLSPESRTVLPSGPVFRWFRPPRVWL